MPKEQSNMPHLDALGLDFNPFPVVPDAHNYFTTEGMNTAISDIMHCIDARKGFILISGEVGLGKTTLSRLLLLKLAVNKVNTALVLNTFLQTGSLLKAINKDFNIHIQSNLIEDQLDALNNFLIEQYSQDKNCVIVIDDAQQLNLESLELIRQLSNLETNQNKLLQIILVAQGEILTTLSRTDMRQLRSRIALSIKIEPLTIQELKQYIQFRLTRAGASGQIELKKDAYKYLHKVSQGFPRQINLIMDRCLYVVAAYEIQLIEKQLVKKAYQEICIDTYSVSNNKTHKVFAIAALFIAVIGSSLYLFKDSISISYLYKDPANIIVQTEAEPINTLIQQQKIGNAPKKLIENSIKTISLANVKQNFTNNSSVKTNKENDILTENKYLGQFGLSDIETDFKTALKKNEFSELNKKLSEFSDYQILIGNGTFSNNKKRIWILNQSNKDEWLTFWKPQLNLNAFYQGFYSENILQLQSLLKDEGFYQSRIDGIVGERTITAISKFQSTVGIKPSGFPDDLTLYQLQNLEQNRSDSGSSVNQVEYYKNKIKNPKNNVSNRYALDNSIITD